MKLNPASKSFLLFGVLILLLTACATALPITPTPSLIFTPIPTFSPVPPPTSTPSPALGTIALDFVSLLCNAHWMNGGQNLETCPGANADHSGGYASPVDSATEGLPAGTPVLLTIPAWNGFSSLFLRYPPFSVGSNDRFRTTLQCRPAMSCDIEFALEYYDAAGKYHSPYLKWDARAGDSPILVDADLSGLAGQTVDFVLTIRLFHNSSSPQQDNGLWIGPHIFRPLP